MSILKEKEKIREEINYGNGEEKRISLSGEAYDMNKQTIYRVDQKK